MGRLHTITCTVCDLEQLVGSGGGMRGGVAARPYGCAGCGSVSFAARTERGGTSREPRCATCGGPLYDLAFDGQHDDDLGPCPRTGCTGHLCARFAGFWD